MRPPRGGLRPLYNRTHSVAKVSLVIPAGATVQVQDEVAAQLLATGDFREGEAPAGLLDALDAGHDARFAEPVTTESGTDSVVKIDDSKPVRRAPARKAAKRG